MMKYKMFDFITVSKRRDAQPLPLWRRVALIFIFAAMAFFAFVMASSYIAGKRLQREVIRIHKAGEPLTFAALRPKKSPSAGGDAADYYNDVIGRVRAGEHSEITKVNTFYRLNLSLPEPNPFPADLKKMVSQNLTRMQPSLDSLDKAAGIEMSGFDMGVLDGREACKNRLSNAETAFLLLSLRTLDAVSTKNSDKAARSVESTFKLMRVFNSQPTMFVQVNKLACARLACSDVLLLLTHCRPTEQQLARIQRIVDELLPNSVLEEMLMAERAYQLEIARNMFPRDFAAKYLSAEEPNLPERLESSRFMWYRMRLRSASVKYLKDMAWYINEANRPWPGPLEKMTDANSPVPKKSGQLARALIPLTRLTAETLAVVRCTSTAVAVERHRLQKGTVPESLSDINPQYIRAIPVDPFTGKPLLYVRDADSFTVYSTGFNRIDDKGSITSKQEKAGVLDSGIRIKRSASK